MVSARVRAKASKPRSGTPVPGSITDHPRAPVEMTGGATFHVSDVTPAEAVAVARQAAAGNDVRIGGGPSTVRELIAPGLVGYAHVVVVPIALGRGSARGTVWRRSGNASRVKQPAPPAASPISHWPAARL